MQHIFKFLNSRRKPTRQGSSSANKQNFTEEGTMLGIAGPNYVEKVDGSWENVSYLKEEFTS